MEPISLLDNVATLVHFFYAQTKQQYIVRSTFMMIPGPV